MKGWPGLVGHRSLPLRFGLTGTCAGVALVEDGRCGRNRTGGPARSVLGPDPEGCCPGWLGPGPGRRPLRCGLCDQMVELAVYQSVPACIACKEPLADVSVRGSGEVLDELGEGPQPTLTGDTGPGGIGLLPESKELFLIPAALSTSLTGRPNFAASASTARDRIVVAGDFVLVHFRVVLVEQLCPGVGEDDRTGRGRVTEKSGEVLAAAVEPKDSVAPRPEFLVEKSGGVDRDMTRNSTSHAAITERSSSTDRGQAASSKISEGVLEAWIPHPGEVGLGRGNRELFCFALFMFGLFVGARLLRHDQGATEWGTYDGSSSGAGSSDWKNSGVRDDWNSEAEVRLRGTPPGPRGPRDQSLRAPRRRRRCRGGS